MVQVFARKQDADGTVILFRRGKGTLELKKKLGHMSWKLLQKKYFTINASSKSWDGFISPDIISGIKNRIKFS